MNRQLTLIGGGGLGASLMYLLDPERGGRRRALLRDKLVSAASQTPDCVGTTARDLGNRARGLVAEAGSLFTSGEAEETACSSSASARRWGA